MSAPIIISLGGSLLSADGVVAFLKEFRKIIVARVKAGDRFVIIVGGGEVCREFQTRARALGKVSARDLDWIGIYATRLNASLLKTVFGAVTTDDLSSGNLKKVLTKVPCAVLGGIEPGGSSDFAAVRHAAACGAQQIFNLSNVSYVYDKDPRKFKDAVAHKKINVERIFKNYWCEACARRQLSV
jgi:uridylate kinase